MTAFHHQAQFCWCLHHEHWNFNMWRNNMFTEESRFPLQQLDCGVKVWIDCCTDRVTALGGVSVMVWGGISLTE